MYDEFQADAVIAENNYGADMVRHTLRSAGVEKRIIMVHSRRGKALRAEPVVGMYEQGRAHHVGIFTELETEMTEWQPYEDKDSPNRVDALVHAATALMSSAGPSSFALPSQLRQPARPRHHLNPIPTRRFP
jgi:phage terminase large subunit-like protein